MRLMHSVALTSAFLLTSTGAAAEEPPTEVGQAYVACMRDAAETPDALEHWVDYCSRPSAVTLRTDADYVACLRDAAGTADALEHWVGYCS